MSYAKIPELKSFFEESFVRLEQKHPMYVSLILTNMGNNIQFDETLQYKVETVAELTDFIAEVDLRIADGWSTDSVLAVVAPNGITNFTQQMVKDSRRK